MSLPLQHARMEVAGFNWKHAKAAEQEKIQLAKQAEEEYNRSRAEAIKRIQSDEFPKTLNRGSQEKHILGAPGRIEGKSYIHGDLKTAQELVYFYFGKGEPTFNRKGEWNQKEVVSADHIIGVNVELDTGAESETSRFVIHYGKKGTHIVPTKELKK